MSCMQPTGERFNKQLAAASSLLKEEKQQPKMSANWGDGFGSEAPVRLRRGRDHLSFNKDGKWLFMTVFENSAYLKHLTRS